MDFNLNEEQRMIADAARKLGARFGLEYWRDHDKRKAFPREFWKAVCAAGIGGCTLPEAYGGSGLGMLEMAVAIEELARGGGGSTVGQLFMLNPIFGGVAINKYGTEEMRRELLPPLCSGDLIFCMALTEPDAGTNTLEITTFAKPDGEGFRLNGRKHWITGTASAGKMLVVARTKKPEEVKKRTEGISLFLIDVEREGLAHGKIDKLGTNTLDSSTIFFDNVYIAKHEVIGTLHNAWNELLDVLNTERIVTTSGLIGTTELALKLAVDYANERRIFGKNPISSYQGIQFPLAQAHAEIACARLMNYKAATNCDSGVPYGVESNLGKLIASQACDKATLAAMQTMGGMGYASEYHVERLWRDQRLFRFAPVSEEMILNFIGQHQLGMPRSY
ncbi:MAG: acyl-CoA/acyl-ACP dehydrogenase [Gammaproteobacteria bacterium]|nr:acyl-CoA/acyl-ACP dehydrogenase [Gammaproteobacteria bacterium]